MFVPLVARDDFCIRVGGPVNFRVSRPGQVDASHLSTGKPRPADLDDDAEACGGLQASVVGAKDMVGWLEFRIGGFV